jgi:hypothetical protein
MSGFAAYAWPAVRWLSDEAIVDLFLAASKKLDSLALVLSVPQPPNTPLQASYLVVAF